MTTIADLMTCKHPEVVVHPLTEGGQLPARTLRACKACGALHLGVGRWQRPKLLERLAAAMGASVPEEHAEDLAEVLRAFASAAGLKGKLTVSAPGRQPVTVDVE